MQAIKNQPLKEWLEEQRLNSLNKMAANSDNPVLKSYYEGISDGYMAALIKMAVSSEGR